jgi:hypothetical protein
MLNNFFKERDEMKKIFVIMFLISLVFLGCQPPVAENQNQWIGGLIAEYTPQNYKAVVILHQGHDAFTSPSYSPSDLRPVAQALYDNGFKVVCFEMPVMPHDGPIDRFYMPVLNYIETLPINEKIYMIGLSGGGWTTTVCTALSTRILKGYSVAGDLPLDMRDAASQGDWEQQNPPYDYRIMYNMSLNRILHIYNALDSCCFSYTGWTEEQLGTPFIIDYSHGNEHMISNWAINTIINDINNILNN